MNLDKSTGENNVVLCKELTQQREQWFTAYRNRDIASMSAIETKEFFAVYHQNVEKKSDWHNNLLAMSEQDELLLHSEKAIKVRHDCLGDSSCIITSHFKDGQKNSLIKEMWVNQQGIWQISSLAISQRVI